LRIKGAEMRATAGSDGQLLLSVTGALEAATGLVLLVAPSTLVELLLGAAPGTPAGVTVSRIAGVAVFALGLACWLARDDAANGAAQGLIAVMLLYNVGVVVILVLAWTSPGLSGIVFWPVVLGHAVLAWCVACLLARTLKEKRF
jgi:hypothetical protein